MKQAGDPDPAMSGDGDTEKGDPIGEGIVERYARRVGYSEDQVGAFRQGSHRVRQVTRLALAVRRYTMEVEVTESRHCNSGHAVGQKLVLDVDGNLIAELCPKRVCVYLLSQLAVPVALIDERLSEGLVPNDFHFMRHVRCPDAGVECLGYGEVRAAIRVVPRRPIDRPNRQAGEEHHRKGGESDEGTL